MNVIPLSKRSCSFSPTVVFHISTGINITLQHSLQCYRLSNMVPILTTLCLLLLAAFCAIAADAQTILDYKILPACARSCEILQISEKNCLPPQAPKTRDTIYIDCLCHSEYLRELHEDGEICHGSCSQRDDIVIHSYFNGLCGTKPSESGHNHSPSKTAAIIVSSESSSPRRLSETSTANGVASTERVEPPPHNQTAAVEEATW